jgi:hypothetical protein
MTVLTRRGGRIQDARRTHRNWQIALEGALASRQRRVDLPIDLTLGSGRGEETTEGGTRKITVTCYKEVESAADLTEQIYNVSDPRQQQGELLGEAKKRGRRRLAFEHEQSNDV